MEFLPETIEDQEKWFNKYLKDNNLKIIDSPILEKKVLTLTEYNILYNELRTLYGYVVIGQKDDTHKIVTDYRYTGNRSHEYEVEIKE